MTVVKLVNISIHVYKHKDANEVSMHDEKFQESINSKLRCSAETYLSFSPDRVYSARLLLQLLESNLASRD